ncbi:class I SAM-dependent methyltransferase [Photobacterium sp. J15]|uniref:class I SAM-dependent methyltransferase n=1 Tax=Photobacterium sp. J15 TaxID=265901 RepID=UPI000A0293FA|nr:class I SAM-dependent methyltransferase [Photobacterium sp. J15]
MNPNIPFYQKNAQRLAEDYLNVSFEDVHAGWQIYWPKLCEEKPSYRVLDIGAGCGRDSKWFAQSGCTVVAVEPAESFRKIGIELTRSLNVCWLDDTLPDLETVSRDDAGYDLILVSAVWMHLPSSQRGLAFRRLTGLLADDGKLVITLRHGSFSDGRVHHGVSADELNELAKGYGLNVCLKTELTSDSMGRNDVQWQTVVIGKQE